MVSTRSGKDTNNMNGNDRIQEPRSSSTMLPGTSHNDDVINHINNVFEQSRNATIIDIERAAEKAAAVSLNNTSSPNNNHVQPSHVNFNLPHRDSLAGGVLGNLHGASSLALNTTITEARHKFENLHLEFNSICSDISTNNGTMSPIIVNEINDAYIALQEHIKNT